MTALLIIAASIFTGIGTYHLACAFVDVPTARTSKMMLLARKQTGTVNENLFDVYLTRISEKLAPFLRLDPMKRGRLAATLNIAGIPLTPERYTMKALLTAFLIALAGLLFLFIMPLFVFLFFGLAVMMWFAVYYKASNIVKKRKKLIEAELPRFAVSIQQSLAADRDVLKLLTSYRKIAGPHLGQELDITIADMKTANYENALLHITYLCGCSLCRSCQFTGWIFLKR